MVSQKNRYLKEMKFSQFNPKLYSKYIHENKKSEDKIKVLFGITLSEIGGAQKVLYDIISSLSEEVYNITLVTSPKGELIKWIDALNVKRKTPIKVILLKNIKREISIKHDLKALYELIMIMRQGKYDIAHFHSSKMGILGRCAAWLCGIPKIYFTVHGWGINDDMSYIKRKILGFAEWISGKLSTKVICVSDYDREKGIKNRWVNRNKVCVIKNGIENSIKQSKSIREEFNIARDIPIIGTVMRLKDPKQPQFTINVFKELIDRGHDLKLVIIGDGPLMDDCKQLIKDYSLDKNVILAGERENARELIYDFNIFTLFSKWEGLPITIIEAMFAGLPVVASRVGGISELVANEINGYLLDGFDYKNGADLIERILLEGTGKMMGVLGNRKAMLEFMKTRMLKEYENIYLEGLTPKKKAVKNEARFLKRSFSWIFLGNTTYAISKGLLIILIAKLGSPEAVGQFALSLAITTPVFMLTGLRLRLVLATDNKKNYSFMDYIILRAITSVIGILICLIIAAVSGYGIEQSILILIMGIARGFESLSDIAFGMLENKEQMDKVGKSMIIKAFATFGAMGLTFLITSSLIMGISGLAFSFFVVLVFYDYRNIRKYIPLNKNVLPITLFKLTRISLPLGILQALVSLNGYIPTYFIKGFLGTEALGYYSSVAYLITIGETINIALGQSLTPRLSKYYASNKKQSFIKTLFTMVGISTAVGVIGLIAVSGFGQTILSVFYTPEYAKYWNIFILLMIAACFQYIGGSLSNGIAAARKFKIQPLLYFLVLIINTAFVMYFIPLKGLDGAAFSVIISSYIHLFGSLIINIAIFKN